MSISTPIDPLFHELVQERGKVYREREQRLKAQYEKQRKADETHERKQLEYMRSAGIKLSAIEQGLKDDARKLKSHLEQKRPSLISRPATNVADGKNAANQAALLGGPGLLIPPYAGVYYPPDGTEVLPIIPGQIKTVGMSWSGSGWGWLEAEGVHRHPLPRKWGFISSLIRPPITLLQRLSHFMDFTSCRLMTVLSPQRTPALNSAFRCRLINTS